MAEDSGKLELLCDELDGRLLLDGGTLDEDGAIEDSSGLELLSDELGGRPLLDGIELFNCSCTLDSLFDDSDGISSIAGSDGDFGISMTDTKKTAMQTNSPFRHFLTFVFLIFPIIINTGNTIAPMKEKKANIAKKAVTGFPSKNLHAYILPDNQ